MADPPEVIIQGRWGIPGDLEDGGVVSLVKVKHDQLYWTIGAVQHWVSTSYDDMVSQRLYGRTAYQLQDHR